MTHLEPRVFDIWVVSRGLPGSYQVSASTERRSQRAVADVSFDPAAPPLAELSTLLAGPATAAQLREIGTALFDRLIVGDVRSLFLLALGEAFGREDSLRVILEIEPPELAVLPWEMLYFAERGVFLATSPRTTLSRTLSLLEPVRSLAAPETLRGLILLPQSSGLDTRAEEAALGRFTAARGGRAEIVKVPGKVTQEAIRQAVRGNEVHLVHFAGHGVFREGEAAVLLDGAADRLEWMTASAFADLFLDSPSVRLVVLNACQGAARSSIAALAGVVPELLRRGIPAVIAMQSTVVNSEATRFAGTFYAELAGGFDPGSIEAALARARGAMLQERPDSPAFASPVLYLRAPDGNLWRDVGPDRKALAEAVRRNAERVRRGLEPYILTRISRKEMEDKYLPAIRSSVAERRGRIIPIVGSAGFGKSTLLGEIFDRLQAESPSWLALVDSGELAVSGRSDLAMALGRAACGVEISIVELAGVLGRAGGPGVLLIDTLDLVLDPAIVPHLQRVFYLLKDTATTVVFTCRDHDYQFVLEPPQLRIPQVADRVDRHTLHAFSEVEVLAAAEAFVEWNPHLRGTLVGRAFVEKLRSLMADQRPLSKITSNPLLLAMLCEVYGKEGDLPRDLTVSELYDRYWDEKVARSRYRGPAAPEALEKPRLCLRIAQQVLEEWREEIRDWIMQVDLDLPTSAPVVEAWDQLLSEGILKQLSGGRVRFFHQTFLEYTIARWLATRAGSAARERVLGAVGSSDEGAALHWWPVLRQLLVMIEVEVFRGIVSRLPLESLAGFRTVSFATISRADAECLADLLRRALELGAEYQKILCSAAEDVPSRFLADAWAVVETLLQSGTRDAAALAATAAGVLFTRGPRHLVDRLGKLLDALEERARRIGHREETGELLGQLLRASLPVLKASSDPEIFRLLQDCYLVFGDKGRGAIIDVFRTAPITEQRRLEFVSFLLEKPPERRLRAELTALLEQRLRAEGAASEQAPGQRIEILYRAVPEPWVSFHARAVARLFLDDPRFTREIVEDFFAPRARSPRCDTNALEELVELGQADRVCGILAAQPHDRIPRGRIGSLATLVRELSRRAGHGPRRNLAQWLQPLAESQPGECLEVFASVADAEETTWTSFLGWLRALFEKDEDRLAKRVFGEIPPGPRIPLAPEIERLVSRHPGRVNYQYMLIDAYSPQVGGSEEAVLRLVTLSLSPAKGVALAASNALVQAAGEGASLSMTLLLPLAGSGISGVRDHLMDVVVAMQNAGNRIALEELVLLCENMAGETNAATLQKLCKVVADWVKTEGKVPFAVAERMASLTSRLESGGLEAGVAGTLIRVLKVMAQLEAPEITALLQEAARRALRGIEHLNRLSVGESEMIDLLSALARPDSSFLPRLVDDGPTLPPRNVRALAASIRRVEGVGSPLLTRMLSADWCPPQTRSAILEFRGA